MGKNSPANAGGCKRSEFYPWVGKITWRRERQPTPVFLGFPGSSDDKESACNARDLGLIPGLGRSPGERKGYPLQYSCLEKPMDRGAWQTMSTAAAKLLQLCPTLCDPIDGSPPGSPVPGILQSRILEWVAIAFSNA